MSSLPLLNESTMIESTQSSLITLTKISSALKNGKLPTSDQLVKGIKIILASDLIQPEVVSSITTKVGGTNKLSKRGKELTIATRQVGESIIRLREFPFSFPLVYYYLYRLT